MINNSSEQIVAHYVSAWANSPEIRRWTEGPLSDLPESFRVLEFRPTKTRRMWTYATCGMSICSASESIELHLFSSRQCDSLVELLTVLSHYHCTGHPLGLGHSVNFGRPWLDDSACDFGLISLPYLDGPDLEEFQFSDGNNRVRFLWLIPITQAERNYKTSNGLDALQQRFEDTNFNYLDPHRPSVV